MPYEPAFEADRKPDESGAIGELDRTDALLGNVLDRFDVLTKRLEPILRTADADPTGPELAQVKRRSSQVVERTATIRDRLELLDSQLASLTARVEL